MDSADLQTQILTIVATILGLATTYVLKILRDFLKKQGDVADGALSEQARARLYPALQYAISFGQASLNADDQGKLAASDSLKKHVIGQAVSYTRAKMGETLDQLGVTDSALEEMLRARLQNALDYLKIPAAK